MEMICERLPAFRKHGYSLSLKRWVHKSQYASAYPAIVVNLNLGFHICVAQFGFVVVLKQDEILG
jgi:hypothetical protein